MFFKRETKDGSKTSWFSFFGRTTQEEGKTTCTTLDLPRAKESLFFIGGLTCVVIAVVRAFSGNSASFSDAFNKGQKIADAVKEIK